MADQFTERYGDLLAGSYDCVDRIVLNAYFPLGHNPGGFRVWWRRWHDDGDGDLDNAHLMRLAGRFARRVRASAAAHGIPVIVCRADERKHRIAEEYLREHDVGVGVFLILVARARRSCSGSVSGPGPAVKIYHHLGGQPVIERPRWNLTRFKVHFALPTFRGYTKGEHVLRSEA